MAAPPPAKNDGKTYYRLAWAIDFGSPHPFGKRFHSVEAAQDEAPEINRQRTANGLVPANYVLELKFRARRCWPGGRYVAGEIFPLPLSRIANPVPAESASARTPDLT